MGLRSQAAADVKAILENTDDFGVAITLTDPAGVDTVLTGFTGDITSVIDPDSGAIVKGRRLHVTLHLESLPAGPRPEVANDITAKPWTVSFARVVGAVVTKYLVNGTHPDDSMGTIVLDLGDWNP
jgi:hypothetical protein